jgi:hypothetical protein
VDQQHLVLVEEVLVVQHGFYYCKEIQELQIQEVVEVEVEIMEM